MLGIVLELTDDGAERVKKLASDLGLSVGEVIERAFKFFEHISEGQKANPNLKPALYDEGGKLIFIIDYIPFTAEPGSS